MNSWIRSKRRKTIKQRILTSLVALPLLICLIVWGSPVLFAVVVSGVIFLAQLEFNRMGLAGQYRMQQFIAALAGATLVPLLYFTRTELLLPWLIVVFLVLSLLFLFGFRTLERLHFQLGWISLGLIYLPLLLGHLFLLRLEPSGRQWIFLTLMAVMLCDSFAYFIGSKLGRRKLYPAVSPNKSVEGAIAGLIGSVVAVLIAKVFFLPAIGFVAAVAIGLVLGLFGQVGDLFESLLKRSCGVKDSGALIPGHGGMLDRLDSLLFAFPVIYYLARYVYGG
jgi:phosphatidate cytidylyltransferase